MGNTTTESITKKYLDDKFKAFESKAMDKIHDLIAKELTQKKTYIKEEDDGRS